MKVIVKCENCGNEAEFTPVTVGQHAYVRRNFRENNLRVSETSFDKTVNLNADSQFLKDLAMAKKEADIEKILDNEIDYNSDVDIKLEELRIDCQTCDNYIVLTEFDV
ncbi:hypothetical protein [Bacillus coahuilensis]|uniref:hypothetical protein n=1 Tax=Bacillus coahuilensis TaxID=408580 RepID=UPI00128F8F6B|nr:hypothetical protein [Bacillus coahuilensis]